MDIDDLHPLRDRVHYFHILPCLKICKRKQKPNFDFQLRSVLLDEMDIKMPKSDRIIEEDPFLLLGFGVNSYFDIMLELMKMNLMITLFLVPMYYCYSHNHQLALKAGSGPKYNLLQYSLGNMGGSHVKCEPKSNVFTNVILSCDTGRVDTTKALFGVMSSQIESKIYCEESAIWADPKNKGFSNCTSMVNEVEM